MRSHPGEEGWGVNQTARSVSGAPYLLTRAELTDPGSNPAVAPLREHELSELPRAINFLTKPSDAKVTRSARSHKELVEAAEKPLPPLSEFTAKGYRQRWAGVWQSYGDIRYAGKIECTPDVTYAQAANLEREAFLHRSIDKVAPTRRRQVMRQRATRLSQTEHSRRRPKRLLYLLRQPRTLIEARFLMETLAWLLAKKVPAAPKLDHSFES